LKIVVLDGAALDPGDLTWQRMERLGTLVRYDRTPEPLIVPRIGDAELIIPNKTPLTALCIVSGVLFIENRIVNGRIRRLPRCCAQPSCKRRRSGTQCSGPARSAARQGSAAGRLR